MIMVQYSVFGSIITVGGMIGAIFSGRIADIFGRKDVSSLNSSDFFNNNILLN